MPKLTDLPLQAAAKIQQYAERGSAELHYARKMFEAGAFKLEPPQNIAAMLADIRRWGEFGMIPALNARRTPHRTAIIDDDGEVTFKELDDAANAVANGLLAMGVRMVSGSDSSWGHYPIGGFQYEVIGHADILVNEGRVREVEDGEVVRYETTG